MEIYAENVNYALKEGLDRINRFHSLESSRLGTVRVASGPVLTTYINPLQRVLFWDKRDANPFFHLMEAIWMLRGHEDVEWPALFNKRFREYSDNRATLRGAYGYRWRKHFEVDQLKRVIEMLRTSPDTRRAVIGIWDPKVDLEPGVDIPCNTTVYFDLRGGQLNMTVVNRSNDAVWGAYGANAVHFSMLQEFVAHYVGAPVGLYRQFSNNLHVYEHHFHLMEDVKVDDRYREGAAPYPIAHEHTTFASWMANADALLWGVRTPARYTEPFFLDVALPMYLAWMERKEGLGDGTRFLLTMPENNDWRIAALEWVARRSDAGKS